MNLSLNHPAARDLFGGSWRLRMVTIAGLMGMVLAVTAPIWMSGQFPLTHEEDRYVVLTTHFRAALEAGYWYPRWLPDLYGGFGYPTFCFYQPLFFFLSGGIAWATGIGSAISVLIATGIFLMVGTLGMFFLARQLAGIPFSLFLTLVFLLTPYVFVNLYVRGDFSELASMMFPPWAIGCLLRIVSASQRGRSSLGATVGLVVSLAAIIPSHPITALAFFGIFPCLALIAAWQFPQEARRTLCLSMTGMIGAIGLAIPYWVPVFQLKPLVNLDSAVTDYFLAYRHVVYWSQFIWNRWDFGASAADSFHDQMPLQLGLIHFVLAASGIVVGFRMRWVRGCALLYFLILFMMSTTATLIWLYVKALAFFQFPWRLLTVTAVLQPLLACGWLSVRQARVRWGLGVLYVFALLILCGPQFRLNPKTTESIAGAEAAAMEKYEKSRTSNQRYANQNEFLPKTASLPTNTFLGAHQRLMTRIPENAIPDPDNGSHHAKYTVDLADAETVKFGQLYFPGWRVWINGGELSEREIKSFVDREGVMEFPFPKGRSTFEAYYAGPPGFGKRMLMMVFTFAVCSGLFWVSKRFATVATTSK